MQRRLFCRHLAATGAALALLPSELVFGSASASSTADHIPTPHFPELATEPVGPGALINGNWVPDANLWFKGPRQQHRVVQVDMCGIWYVPDDSLNVMVLQPFHRTCNGGKSEQGLLCQGNLYYTTVVPVKKKPVPLM